MSDESETVIAGHVILTNPDLEAAIREMPNRARAWFRVIFFLFLAGLFVQMGFWGDWEWAAISFVLIVLLLVPAIWFTDRWITPKLWLPALKPEERDLTVRFEADALEMVTPISRARLGYTAILRVVEARSALFIQPKNGLIQVIPKRAFTDAALARIRERLQIFHLLRKR